MKRVFFGVLLGLITASPHISADSIGYDALTAYYDDLFTADVQEYGENKYIVLGVIDPPEGHPLTKFVEDHRSFLNYLLQNGTEIEQERLTELKQDVEKMKTEFRHQLKSDEVFGRLIQPLFARALQMKGMDVPGYEPAPLSEVSMADLTGVAMRFFYPNRVLEDGIAGNICVGKHGLADFEGERNPVLEALAFSAIMRDMQTEEKTLYQEFHSVLTDVVGLRMSSDDETKVRRAQGAVWFAMSRSEFLTSCLLREYESMRRLLPFELAPPGEEY